MAEMKSAKALGRIRKKGAYHDPINVTASVSAGNRLSLTRILLKDRLDKHVN